MKLENIYLKKDIFILYTNKLKESHIKKMNDRHEYLRLINDSSEHVPNTQIHILNTEHQIGIFNWRYINLLLYAQVF